MALGMALAKSCPRKLNAPGFDLRHEAVERLSPMGERVFLRVRHFGERLGRTLRDKNRVIAKSIRAPRRIGNDPIAGAHAMDQDALDLQGKSANKAR